ncbi:FAD/NAD(P)-binding domain-containing protein [Annulohypoxylon truncatum]|uniref:FAD/NAD(P)-binding domain-containing protein n=1 Tax=Annulohypoxylon truncatum TaxID=327061 RepID=UPI0020074EED|nr:FAD/NAD(P)-binding domain-containing protein [Annulohypoxylon truncatum]KAI1214739.1 FAD/NAD(P)-binding domain-containing protein [Annulohypoxylon truncatum]
MEEFDYVVVGAGFHGLAAAKQFHCLNPNRTIAVFDGQSTLGGKWAVNRLFPGLKSNNLLGTYEYPDFPMSSEKFNVQPGEHIPGEVINAYLKAYAEEFDIINSVRLETPVLAAEHQDTVEGGWILTVQPPKQAQVKVFARRLIIATGLLSEPFMPRFKGQDEFGGKIFHSRDFPQNSDTLNAKTVTVFGAGKSGWDAVYQYASAGVKVHWVIRSSGHGPVWIAPPYVTPFKKWIEKLSNTRFLTWFSPCIWGDADGYVGIRNFYHRTPIGRFIVDRFWNILSQDVIGLNKFDSHPDTAKLKPWLEVMFTGCSYSILNYEQDIFELIKSDKVEIHIGEISNLSLGKVHLSDGTEFESEAFLANTGWKHVPPMKFLPEGIEKELGIPHEVVDQAPPEDLANQRALIERADREILQRFPRLKRQPVWNRDFVPLSDQKGIVAEATSRTSLTPYMLYRFLIPPSPRFLRSRDVAFIGLQTNFSNIITAHISALWINAYFEGQLTIDPAKAVDNEEAVAKLQYETMLHNRFGKWRYPTEWGNKGPNFIFDAVPYLDLLQHDLGLNPHKKGGMLVEMYSPYGPEDYRNVNEEWLQKLKEGQASKGTDRS